MSKPEIVVQLSRECTINNTVTPIRRHLRGYFSQLIHKNKQSRCQHNKAGKLRIKPKFYGEALTTDDIYDRIKNKKDPNKRKVNASGDSKKEGSAKVSSKKNKSPNVTCKSRSRKTLKINLNLYHLQVRHV